MVMAFDSKRPRIGVTIPSITEATLRNNKIGSSGLLTYTSRVIETSLGFSLCSSSWTLSVKERWLPVETPVMDLRKS
jgi:hypothetical protein